MANHKSAAKRARQAVVRNARNRSYVSKIRTAVKKVRVSIENAKNDSAELGKVQEAFIAAQSLLHKAVGKKILHRNNAARRIGRLAQAIGKLSGRRS